MNVFSHPGERPFHLDFLGMSDEDGSKAEKSLGFPNGLIIVSGLPGSGRTYTMYSLLRKMNREDMKIITMEENIEHKLKGITRIKIVGKKGLNYRDAFEAAI